MKKWLLNLLEARREATEPGKNTSLELKSGTETSSGSLAGHEEEAEPLRAEQEIQSLQMELREHKATIEKMRQEIERLRSRQEEFLVERIETRLGALFGDLSTPASQILTQAYLLEEERKPVQVHDVLFVARRIIHTLEEYGLVFEGQVGDQVAFDLSRHTLISAGNQPKSGQSVTVRFAGTSYAGKIISKAGVE